MNLSITSSLCLGRFLKISSLVILISTLQPVLFCQADMVLTKKGVLLTGHVVSKFYHLTLERESLSDEQYLLSNVVCVVDSKGVYRYKDDSGEVKERIKGKSFLLTGIDGKKRMGAVISQKDDVIKFRDLADGKTVDIQSADIVSVEEVFPSSPKAIKTAGNKKSRPKAEKVVNGGKAAGPAVNCGDKKKTAPPTTAKKIVSEIGVETSSLQYHSPSRMKESGLMTGVVGSIAYHNKIMLKAEGRGSWGEVDYKGAGTINDIDNYILEFRGLLGYDFVLGDHGEGENNLLTPFVGFGYRYLDDNMKERTSSTGAQSYERESNYFYVPIGLEGSYAIKNGWSLGATAEYDLFLWGKQVSHFEETDTGWDALTNTQQNGYGLRGSVKLMKKSKRVHFFIEPFIRYWSIQQTKYKDITSEGSYTGLSGRLPANHSTEVGVKTGIVF